MIYIVHVIDQGELVAATQLPDPELLNEATVFIIDKATIARVMAAIPTHNELLQPIPEKRDILPMHPRAAKG